MQTDLRASKLISVDLLSSTTMSKRCSNPYQDGANKTISSAYAKILINTPPILHPTLEVTTLVSRSLMYHSNNYGDKTPPCRVPLPRLKNSDKQSCQRTHIRVAHLLLTVLMCQQSYNTSIHLIVQQLVEQQLILSKALL